MASKKGAAAFLALFANGDCKRLAHDCCAARLCPCNDARKWLASLPKRMAFEDIWNACDRNDWLLWLARAFGLNGGKTTDETRRLIPWDKMANALANPPEKSQCEYCNDLFSPDELDHGYCEDCASDHRVFCVECDEFQDRDDNHPCAHIWWCDQVGDFVGTGADDSMDIAESFDALLVKLGLVLTRKLLIELDRGRFGKRRITNEFGDCGSRFDELWNLSRDIDDASFEQGLLWLDTLHPHQKEHVAMAKAWIREHISRREKAIDADKSPRRILVDGDGRVYVNGGTWSAVRAHATRMTRRLAHKLRKRIEGAFPGVALRVVHVLKPAPAWKKGTAR